MIKNQKKITNLEWKHPNRTSLNIPIYSLSSISINTILLQPSENLELTLPINLSLNRSMWGLTRILICGIRSFSSVMPWVLKFGVRTLWKTICSSEILDIGQEIDAETIFPPDFSFILQNILISLFSKYSPICILNFGPLLTWMNKKVTIPGWKENMELASARTMKNLSLIFHFLLVQLSENKECSARLSSASDKYDDIC